MAREPPPKRRGHAQGATVCRESAGGERKSVPAFEMPQRRGLAPWNPAGGGAGRGGDSAVRPLSFPKAALGRRVTHSE